MRTMFSFINFKEVKQMNKLKEALWADYEENSNLISDLDVDSQEYRSFKDERDKIRNELIKVIQIEEDKNIKELEIESNNRNEKIKNRITIGTFVVTSVISVYTVIKTFKFDEEATITSTLGRNIISNITSKLFKR